LDSLYELEDIFRFQTLNRTRLPVKVVNHKNL